MQDDFEWASRIDRNPTMNPLKSDKVETGDEYDTTDEEVSDGDSDDSDEGPDSEITQPADIPTPSSEIKARRAQVVAAAAFAESAQPIGAALPPGYTAAEPPSLRSASAPVSHSQTASGQSPTDTQTAPPAMQGQPHTTRPTKVRKLSAPVSKPGRKSAADKQYETAYKAQQAALEASRRIQRDMYWRRAFKQP
jgi:hypothetical protein